MAEGCIIIARGAVTISSSRRNLIVAGQYAGISSDRASSIRVGRYLVRLRQWRGARGAACPMLRMPA